MLPFSCVLLFIAITIPFNVLFYIIEEYKLCYLSGCMLSNGIPLIYKIYAHKQEQLPYIVIAESKDLFLLSSNSSHFISNLITKKMFVILLLFNIAVTNCFYWLEIIPDVLLDTIYSWINNCLPGVLYIFWLQRLAPNFTFLGTFSKNIASMALFHLNIVCLLHVTWSIIPLLSNINN